MKDSLSIDCVNNWYICSYLAPSAASSKSLLLQATDTLQMDSMVPISLLAVQV